MNDKYELLCRFIESARSSLDVRAKDFIFDYENSEEITEDMNNKFIELQARIDELSHIIDFIDELDTEV